MMFMFVFLHLRLCDNYLIYLSYAQSLSGMLEMKELFWKILAPNGNLVIVVESG